MKKMGLNEVRSAFLDFFRSKDHLVEQSFSLVPKNDKSLLLIGAGMAPLKKYFTGEITPPKKRMATCQKCIRTGDIENVGITDRHATFFEMLGNFSFGDYFKLEAIKWAWEFLTERLEFDPERLWVTIYLDDDEAFKIWHEVVGLPKERIVRLGKEDNFWELEVGPSGPDSEIFYDRGKEFGEGPENQAPGGSGDRFIEVWNLVFTQFDKDESGNYNPLKNPNIDTGMGLERITCVLEGVKTIFDIEIIRSIISAVEKKAGVEYGKGGKKDISIRVITDHIRASVFMASDGILPSNEGRGYVLRKIIRRAVRHGKLLGIEGSFLPEIAEVVIEEWKGAYNNLSSHREEILGIISAEEGKFHETLSQGLDILKEYILDIGSYKRNILSGEAAFKLYDTYGFPFDLTVEILREQGITADKKTFEELMDLQRETARKSREVNNIGWESEKLDEEIKNSTETQFDGYTKSSEKSKVLFLLRDGEKVDSLKKGEKGIAILDKTPFYGESGGQVGDLGCFSTENCSVEITDTVRKNDHILHFVVVGEGELKKGESVNAEIDGERRYSIRKNHSATHLLDQALKDVLGEHISQAGSVVAPDKLRFDFTHFKPMTAEEISSVEKIVNREIFNALPVETIETSLDNAMNMGAIGLFEDKYKKNVRVLKMGDYSMELCGGTHVSNTSEIGLFKIVSETGIAAGVRRIEAVTSKYVYSRILEEERLLEEISEKLKAPIDQLLNRVSTLVEEIRLKDKELEKFHLETAHKKSLELVENAVEINGIKTLVAKIGSMDMSELRTLGDELKSKLNPCALVLASVKDGKPQFVAMATEQAVKKGFNAGSLIKEVAKLAGGGGGGRPAMAQAGGKNPEKLSEALEMAEEIIKSQIC